MDNNNENISSNFIAAQRGRTLRRGKTLNRPERFNAPEPMLKGKDKRSQLDLWVIFSRLVTFWAPGFILRKLGFPDKNVIQAWREKVALCFIITLICAFVVFITLFMSSVICPSSEQDSNKNVFSAKQNINGYYIVNGYVFDGLNVDFENEPPNTSNTKLIKDVSLYFNQPQPKECAIPEMNSQVLNFDFCTIQNACQKDINSISDIGLINTTKKAGYDWDYLPNDFFVLDGVVIDMTPYFSIQKQAVSNDEIDNAIREVVNKGKDKDATRIFLRKPNLEKSIDCIKKKYYAGLLTKKTVGCFGVDLFQNVALVVVLGIVLIRFLMAAAFHWFLSHRLSRTPKRYGGKTVSVNDTPFNIDKNKARKISNNPNELFAVMLVTCYSEGEDSMRTTLDSLANTEYSDDKKLLFVIADGIITGSGNDKSTPDIIKELIDIDPLFSDPEPKSYIAIADGAKQHNMAKVYCGHYCINNHRVPILAVIKCGTPSEQDKPKPGNRGKRDSQLILMGFFSRVIYNDRMTPLDYDLFIKTQHLMGVTPDYFETVLMVDADTKVYPSSLRLLTNCLLNDTMVMGLCGETKIANKKDSLVTTIQVFEYYISHHLGKGFESVFGGVTCLPGCFCMYRLKAPKGTNDWVPILTKPEIIQEYSQNIVETLHQKNLLLLGEDRFLTTLMLRNFPNRKMMFVPQAICKTVVPDEFSVLLSQRRRWINSTIHNLLELVLVRNLCGTFCFSMQFVIFMELIGTVALPVAIIMTYYLIISLFFVSDIKQSVIPLLLLIIVLFSPAILILITTRKLIYVAWMFVYLVFLFVWNFILPVYSYWHFDDFSWGATRMVEGEVKGDAHGKKEGMFNAQDVSLKRWDEYERERILKQKKEQEINNNYENEANDYVENLSLNTDENTNNNISRRPLPDQNAFNNNTTTENSNETQTQMPVSNNRKSRLMGPRPLK